MGNIIDITGMRFGRLVVDEYAGHGKWKCTCDCGNETIASTSCLKSGDTKSCGCYQKERARQAKTVHGCSSERLYVVWKAIKQRCLNPNYKEFHLYGGRGIAICKEWEIDYLSFKAWAYSNGYDENAKRGQCTLDRIDNDGDYEPSNCRWADAKTQRRNQRQFVRKNPSRNHAVDLVDENTNIIKHYKSITDASKETGCPISSISAVCAGRYKTSLGKRWRYANT